MDRDEILRAVRQGRLSSEDIAYLMDALCRLLVTPDVTVSEKVMLFLKSREDLSVVRRETAASFLCMSPRTLSRKLRMENRCFHELLDRERRRRCLAGLAHGIVCADTLSIQLGLSDVSHFYKLFRQWTGRGFSDYKRDLAGKYLNNDS